MRWLMYAIACVCTGWTRKRKEAKEAVKKAVLPPCAAACVL